MTAPTKAKKCKLCGCRPEQRYEVFKQNPSGYTYVTRLCEDCARWTMKHDGVLVEPELPARLTAPVYVCPYCSNERDGIPATPTRAALRHMCDRHRVEHHAAVWKEAAIALAIVIVLLLVVMFVHFGGTNAGYWPYDG